MKVEVEEVDVNQQNCCVIPMILKLTNVVVHEIEFKMQNTQCGNKKLRKFEVPSGEYLRLDLRSL